MYANRIKGTVFQLDLFLWYSTHEANVVKCNRTTINWSYSFCVTAYYIIALSLLLMNHNWSRRKLFELESGHDAEMLTLFTMIKPFIFFPLLAKWIHYKTIFNLKIIESDFFLSLAYQSHIDPSNTHKISHWNAYKCLKMSLFLEIREPKIYLIFIINCFYHGL